MYHVDFVRLGAKCDLCDHWKLHSGMVYATIKNFSHVRSMQPVICIYSFVYDGSMWEPVLITQYSIVYVFLSVFVLICYILRIGRKSRKCH